MSNLLTAEQLAQKLRELQKTSYEDFIALVHQTENALHKKTEMKGILNAATSMSAGLVGSMAITSGIAPTLAFGAFAAQAVTGVLTIKHFAQSDAGLRSQVLKKIQADISKKFPHEKLSPTGSSALAKVWGSLKARVSNGQVQDYSSARFAELSTKVAQINQYSNRQMEESLGYASDRITDGHRKHAGMSLIGIAAAAGAALGSGVAMTGIAGAAPLALAGYAAYHAIQSMRDHSNQALLNLAKETSKAFPDQKLDTSGTGLVSRMLGGLRNSLNRHVDGQDEVESARESARPA